MGAARLLLLLCTPDVIHGDSRRIGCAAAICGGWYSVQSAMAIVEIVAVTAHMSSHWDLR